MSILVSGSVAYDTIMVFEDRFKNHILPDQVHSLNVSFYTPKMQRFLGGCGGNVGYTLNKLGEKVTLMATVGKDFDPYRQWLQEQNISLSHVKEIETEFTAQAFITTDLDNNQINAFHPGAMNHAHRNRIEDAQNIHFAIVSPNSKRAMIEHAEDLARLKIPFIFDPGQGLPMFERDELLRFIEIADYAIFNDYESQMMMHNSNLSRTALAEKFVAMIITRGAKGSSLFENGEEEQIECAPINEAFDPTGCGDAYRAGVLHGLSQGTDWSTAARIGSVCGAIKIEHHGTQKHPIDSRMLKQRFERSYQQELNLTAA